MLDKDVFVIPDQLKTKTTKEDKDKDPVYPISALHVHDRHLADWADKMLVTQQHLINRAAKLQAEKDRLHMELRDRRIKSTTQFEADWFASESHVSSYSYGPPCT